MGRSLALALHLALAGGGRTGRGFPPRPPGRLIWMHLAADAAPTTFGQLARRLLRDAPAARLLVTARNPPADPAPFPPGTLVERLDAARTGAVAELLSHFGPDLAVFAGSAPVPAAIVAAHGRGIPVVLVDLRLRRRDLAGWRARGTMLGALLARCDRVLVRDHDTAERIIRLAGGGVSPVVAGPIEEIREPLPCAEAEREALSRLVGARPVWMVAGCTEAEEEAVIAAHSQAMRFAHRLLLIVVPSDPGRGAALAERTGREGWVVALRSQDQDPDADVQLLIDDGDGEYGLWYRLAPFVLMGGTLSEGSVRNPMEAAALGSAILAGPAAGGFVRAYARLSAARAFRALRMLSDLSEAVVEMIAPDKAAILAHNAWAVSSGGVEAADRIAAAVSGLTERRPVPATEPASDGPAAGTGA
ncbi:MAG: 3-deoxy-D-manno-octulosonic acid transferase [Pseudomonadota bacterium]